MPAKSIDKPGERDSPCGLCREMAGELTDICGWLAGGELTPEDFRVMVVTFEARKLARFGFKLESALSEHSTVHFSLRFARTGELCASMDVDPRTGEISLQHACA